MRERGGGLVRDWAIIAAIREVITGMNLFIKVWSYCVFEVIKRL